MRKKEYAYYSIVYKEIQPSITTLIRNNRTV